MIKLYCLALGAVGGCDANTCNSPEQLNTRGMVFYLAFTCRISHTHNPVMHVPCLSHASTNTPCFTLHIVRSHMSVVVEHLHTLGGGGAGRTLVVLCSNEGTAAGSEGLQLVCVCVCVCVCVSVCLSYQHKALLMVVLGVHKAPLIVRFISAFFSFTDNSSSLCQAWGLRV